MSPLSSLTTVLRMSPGPSRNCSMSVVAGTTLRPRAGTSAKAVLLTVLGELVLPGGGAAWTGTLVESLTRLDVEEKNARQAISRLADDGLLAGERAGRRVRWHLTAEACELLTAGTERIYAFGGP